MVSFCGDSCCHAIRHTWQNWEVWADTDFNQVTWKSQCRRWLYVEVTEINQIPGTLLHRDNLMSVCALKQWRLCWQFDTGIPDIFPKLGWKDQPVIYRKGRQSCTKARGRKEIKVLKQNKLSLSDWGFFSFQETFKMLISSKNLILRIIFLKKWNTGLKKIQFSCLFFFLFGWFPLSLFPFFHFFNDKIGKKREKRKCWATTKKPGHFLYKCWWNIWINKVFMLYAKAFKMKTFLKIIFLPSLLHKP